MALSYTVNRPLEAELMDSADLPLPDVERALADLDRVNHKLFGYSASRRALMPRILAGPRCQTLVDLGTGSGKISCRIKQLALRHGVHIRVLGVDRKLCHLLYGHQRNRFQLRVVADAEALPLRTGTVDWSFSNLVFHHFSPGENNGILSEMRRVARRAAVVVDLRQAVCARGLIRLLLPLLRIGPVASHDGKLSTDQAWCIEDVSSLTELMPVEELKRRFPFRFSLVVRATGDTASSTDST